MKTVQSNVIYTLRLDSGIKNMLKENGKIQKQESDIYRYIAIIQIYATKIPAYLKKFSYKSYRLYFQPVDLNFPSLSKPLVMKLHGFNTNFLSATEAAFHQG